MSIGGRHFQRIAMDSVEPLPKTSWWNRYTLVVCDHATHHLEVAAPRVAKQLIQPFSTWIGITEEILTDQGTNFMAVLCEELYCPDSKDQTNLYHPETDES